MVSRLRIGTYSIISGLAGRRRPKSILWGALLAHKEGVERGGVSTWRGWSTEPDPSTYCHSPVVHGGGGMPKSWTTHRVAAPPSSSLRCRRIPLLSVNTSLPAVALRWRTSHKRFFFTGCCSPARTDMVRSDSRSDLLGVR